MPYKNETTTDENGNKVTTKVVDTDKQNANLNQMVRVLTGKASGDAETKLQTDFKAMQGFDTLTYGDKNYDTVYTNRAASTSCWSRCGAAVVGAISPTATWAVSPALTMSPARSPTVPAAVVRLR